VDKNLHCNAGTQVQSLIRQLGPPTCCRATKLMHCNYLACTLWSLCATTREAVHQRKILHDAVKILYATIKTLHSQINIIIKIFSIKEREGETTKPFSYHLVKIKITVREQNWY